MNLLDILKAGAPVSGEEIARVLRISRAAVHKQVNKLRTAGYGITGTRNSGYTLLSRPDIVTPGEIRYYLKKNGVPEHEVLYFPVTTSTQDEAKRAAGAGVKFPFIAVADSQTGAYGRRRRQWSSPEGGLWFSLALRPDLAPEKIPQLTLAASLAVCRAVEVELGLAPLIKWPNDVTLGGKKFAGILTEMSAEVGRLNWVIIGIGINANNELPRALEATASSLSIARGDKINRAELLAGILSEFYGVYNIFVEKGFAAFEKEYNRKSLLNGSRVRVDNGDGVIEGEALRVDAAGYLWIKPDGKNPIKIIAGDVLNVRRK